MFIPTGTTALSGDGKGSIEATLTRVTPNSPNVKGVSVDAAGNVYVSDGNDGVYLVPLVSGVPTPANAVLLTTAAAQGNAVPGSGWRCFVRTREGVTGVSDVAKIYLNAANLGMVAVGGTSATPGTVVYSFNATVGSPTTPNNYVIEENGNASKNFAIASGGSCDLAGATAYPYQTTDPKTHAVTTTSSCTLNINFTPAKLGR